MYIYIASPYTIGNKLENTKASLMVAAQLLLMGHVPFAPLLTHFWDEITPRSYEEWLELDFKWILRCDAVLRLPGESNGADAEVEFAQDNGIGVYFGIQDLINEHLSMLL